MKPVIIVLILSLAFAAALGAQEAPLVRTSFDAELGAVKVLSHTYRVGVAGTATDFDFVAQGGQEILLPFSRLTAGLAIADDHLISLLYQPLSLDTEAVFRTPVVIDGTTFAAQTPMRLSYGFPFYRLTYQYRFLKDEGSWLAGGAALQLRNASIKFASLDGKQLVVSQNLGLVPALALSGRLGLGAGFFAAFERRASTPRAPSSMAPISVSKAPFSTRLCASGPPCATSATSTSIYVSSADRRMGALVTRGRSGPIRSRPRPQTTSRRRA